MDTVHVIIVQQLQALRSDISGMRSEIHVEFKDVKARLNHVEQSLTGVWRDSAL